TIPPISPSALEIVRLCDRDESNFEAIAALAGREPGIAARLVVIANSPIFGTSRDATDAAQAISVAGLRGTRVAALVSWVADGMGRKRVAGFDHERFWRDALVTALAACRASQLARTGRREEAFLGGLVQDLGVLALAAAAGESYALLLREAESEGVEIATLEKSRLGLHHGELAAEILQTRSFPPEILVAVRCHPEGPAKRPPRTHADRLTACLHVAEGARRALRKPDLTTLAELRSRAAKTLGLAGNEVSDILQHVQANLDGAAELLALPIGSPTDLPEIHRQAQDLLVRASAESR
ncbi:MAG TPA: HDOD domain-containing protein, partial [Planctomycetota bacterium]|nr:HDOD domain-containing protein [Planctomycetota bacterium]